MGKRFVYTLTLLLGFFLLTNFSAAEPPKDAKTSQWTKRMKELYQTLSELLPDVASEKRFNSLANIKKIEKNAKKLSVLAHDLGKMPAVGAAAKDLDPSVPLISGLFQTEAAHAYDELKRGRRAYARSILKSIPGFCVGCHTRSTGTDFSALTSDDALKSMSRIERAEFLAATRQFDQAFQEFERIIADPNSAQGQQLEWERSVREALAIAVRVKRDPEKSLAIVDRVIASPASPQFLKDDAIQWRESIKQWQTEVGRTPTTEGGLYAESKRLVAQAHSLQKYPTDRAADILYLRTSAVVHDLLRSAPDGIHVPEALFLLGVSYQALRDLNLWSLHELYYEACIRRAPHSEIAQACYNRIEEDTYAGYSGSGGLSLPADVKAHLAVLRDLARPAAGAKSP